jgi:hypothetical protein
MILCRIFFSHDVSATQDPCIMIINIIMIIMTIMTVVIIIFFCSSISVLLWKAIIVGSLPAKGSHNSRQGVHSLIVALIVDLESLLFLFPFL